jgi:hypothetical protein
VPRYEGLVEGCLRGVAGHSNPLNTLCAFCLSIHPLYTDSSTLHSFILPLVHLNDKDNSNDDCFCGANYVLNPSTHLHFIPHYQEDNWFSVVVYACNSSTREMKSGGC